MTVRKALGLFLVSLSFAALALAQGTSGSFTGTVSDSTGAVIPAASVTATSVDSGRTWRTQTNDVGVYNLPSVPPGSSILPRKISERRLPKSPAPRLT